MPKDKILIAPYDSGLVKDMKPWLLTNQAFSRLDNAQIYQGRVVKRFGTRYCYGSDVYSELNSRLRVYLGTTDGSGNISGTVPGQVFTIGQMFSAGDDILEVAEDGSPGNLISKNNSIVGEYHTIGSTPGNYSISGADPNVQVYFYPSEYVTGIHIFENITSTTDFTVAFDMQFSYKWDGGSWLRFTDETWLLSSYSHRFKTTMFRSGIGNYNILFATSFNGSDHLKYYTPSEITVDGSTINANTWNQYTPIYDSSSGLRILDCKIPLFFNDRLLLFGLREEATTGTIVYEGRVRWSKPGNVLENDAFTSSSSGYIEAPTEEYIRDVIILKDHIIVFFEDSIWELVYTYNADNPFIWKRLNNEFGAASNFSAILKDENIYSLSHNGIVVTNGVQAKNIDTAIPEDVYKSFDKNSIGTSQICSAKDDYFDYMYWAIPDGNQTLSQPFLRKILAFNQLNGAWSYIDESITAFGYFMEGAYAPNGEHYVRLIAGNQQGFIFIIDIGTKTNAGLVHIANIDISASYIKITAKDHNFIAGDYVHLNNILQKEGHSGDITALNDLIFKVSEVIDKDNFKIVPDSGETFDGVYGGSGIISKVTPIDILTKEYGFFLGAGANTSIDNLSVMVTKTDYGKFTIDFYASTASLSMVSEGKSSGMLVGNNVVETYPYADSPMEGYQDRIWRTLSFPAEGETVQFRFYLSDDDSRANSQVRNPQIYSSDFELHAMLMNVSSGAMF